MSPSLSTVIHNRNLQIYLYTNITNKYITIECTINSFINYHRRWKLANNVLENLSQLYLPTGLLGLLTVSKGDRSTVQLVFVTKRLVFVTKRLYIKVLTRNKLKPF